MTAEQYRKLMALATEKAIELTTLADEIIVSQQTDATWRYPLDDDGEPLISITIRWHKETSDGDNG
jgi:hypothetical protein